MPEMSGLLEVAIGGPGGYGVGWAEVFGVSLVCLVADLTVIALIVFCICFNVVVPGVVKSTCSVSCYHLPLV